jgi:hypothetical protein
MKQEGRELGTTDRETKEERIYRSGSKELRVEVRDDGLRTARLITIL